VLADIKPAGTARGTWSRDRPAGERSVWVVERAGRGRPALVDVVLKAGGPAGISFRHGPRRRQVVALRYPLEFLSFHEERGDLGEISLAPLDLSHRVAVVGGANSNVLFPDVPDLLDHAVAGDGLQDRARLAPVASGLRGSAEPRRP